MALLEVEGVRRSFGGLVAVDGVSLAVTAGPDQRRHRPQRRRQDHPVQHDLRPAQAGRRANHLQGPPDQRFEALPDCPRRHLAHVPESQPVPADERAGERHGRAATAGRAGISSAAACAGRAKPGKNGPFAKPPAPNWSMSAWRTWPTGRRARCRLASGGWSSWRARWPPNRRCCCWTSPPAD